jgi:hypothetical protein
VKSDDGKAEPYRTVQRQSCIRRYRFVLNAPPASQATSSFLTLSKPVRIMQTTIADVAELADAQVSEACDGDIVEVQVLSSAPNSRSKRAVC